MKHREAKHSPPLRSVSVAVSVQALTCPKMSDTETAGKAD